MSIIVTAGWSIYPLGYFCGYLLGAVDETLLIVVYNVADFVNKFPSYSHAGLRSRMQETYERPLVRRTRHAFAGRRHRDRLLSKGKEERCFDQVQVS